MEIALFFFIPRRNRPGVDEHSCDHAAPPQPRLLVIKGFHDFYPTTASMKNFDVTIIGAGAAGLYCAGVAGRFGLSVLLLDHAPKIAEKIRISGGGRCNFTNRDIDATAPQRHFLSDNPPFCRSALSRHTAQDFIDLLRRNGVGFHEKHKGQLFCDRSAQDVIDLLLAECVAGGVTHWQPCSVERIVQMADGAHQDSHSSYRIDSNRGSVASRFVVVATGGLSIPKIGASGFGYAVARQFGLRVVEPRPALVPLTLDGPGWQPFAQLSGLALPVCISTGRDKKTRAAFSEDLLFTHRGLSGPAALQISSYWRAGVPVSIDLLPQLDTADVLTQAKATSQKTFANELAALLPARLAAAWAEVEPMAARRMSEVPRRVVDMMAARLSAWQLSPAGTEGWNKAEVTAGGIDTRDLSSRTMESRQRGLYFIGEVVDVTGWLGGYNFQWAWSSAHACAQALAQAAAQTGAPSVEGSSAQPATIRGSSALHRGEAESSDRPTGLIASRS